MDSFQCTKESICLPNIGEEGAKAKKIRTWEKACNGYQNLVAEKDSQLFSNANIRVGRIEVCGKQWQLI